jgi:hypothetical protein
VMVLWFNQPRPQVRGLAPAAPLHGRSRRLLGADARRGDRVNAYVGSLVALVT